MALKYYRVNQICPHIFPVGRSTFLQWVKDGIAPAPIKLGLRTTVWSEESLEQFAADMAAAGSAAELRRQADEINQVIGLPPEVKSELAFIQKVKAELDPPREVKEGMELTRRIKKEQKPPKL